MLWDVDTYVALSTWRRRMITKWKNWLYSYCCAKLQPYYQAEMDRLEAESRIQWEAACENKYRTAYELRYESESARWAAQKEALEAEIADLKQCLADQAQGDLSAQNTCTERQQECGTSEPAEAVEVVVDDWTETTGPAADFEACSIDA